VAKFDYTLDFQQINFREHPELYRVGVGEQGVLLVEPYKSEILPHWRFATPEWARASADIIYAMFCDYLEPGDFVGADMQIPANGLHTLSPLRQPPGREKIRWTGSRR
jgi:hypothetical protein